jgi:hypothetical protein
MQTAQHDAFRNAMRVAGVADQTVNALVGSNIATFDALRKASRSDVVRRLSAQERQAVRRASVMSLVSSNPAVIGALVRQRSSLSGIARGAEMPTGVPAADTTSMRARARILANVIRMRRRLMRGSERNPSSVVVPAVGAIVPDGDDFSDWLLGQSVFGASGPSDVSEPLLYHRAAPLPQRGPRALSAPDAAPLDVINSCVDQVDAFSPSAYLVYLLDFVAKSFGQTLAQMSQTYFQKFEELPAATKPGDDFSYVYLGNLILENRIAQAMGGARPNEGISWLWADLHRSISTAANTRRVAVYDEFKQAAYTSDPRFDANVLVRLFDAHVREIGTTRREANFHQRGSVAFRTQFASEYELKASELPVIDLQDNQIGLGQVQQLADLLGTVLFRRDSAGYRDERIAVTADSLLPLFRAALAARRSSQLDELVLTAVGAIPTTTPPDELDRLLVEKRTAASACLHTGVSCPTGKSAIVPLDELFRRFAAVYDAAATSNAVVTAQHARLLSELSAARKEELKREAAAEGRTVTDATLDPLAQSYANQTITSDQVLEAEFRGLATRIVDSRLGSASGLAEFRQETSRRADQNWKEAVTRAESGLLAQIRSNLIVIALTKLRPPAADFDADGTANSVDADFAASGLNVAPPAGTSVINDRTLRALSNHLLMDLSAAEGQRTTTIAFAMGRIHTFVQQYQLGTRAVGGTTFSSPTWSWMRSYGTFHAASTVSVYPGNFLIPELRRNVTPAYKAVVDSFAEVLPRDLEQVFTYYQHLVAPMTRMRVLSTARLGERAMVLATNEKALFYTTVDRRGTWSSWRELEGVRIPDALNLAEPSQVFLLQLKDAQPGTQSLFLFSARTWLISDDPVTDDTQECTTTPPATICSTLRKRISFIPLDVKGDTAVTPAVADWALIPGAYIEFSMFGSLTSPLIYHQLTSTRFFTLRMGAYFPQILIGFNDAGEIRYVGRNIAAAGSRPAGHSGAIATAAGEILWRHGTTATLTYEGVVNNRITITAAGSPSSLTLALDAAGVPSISYQFGVPHETRILQLQGGAFQELNRVPMNTSTHFVAGAIAGETFLLFGNRSTPVSGGLSGFESVEAIASLPSGLGSAAEGLRISFPRRGSFMGSVIPDAWKIVMADFGVIDAADPARQYLDEMFLHLPMWLADRLNEAGRYEDAMRALSRVYDPMRLTAAERQVYPGFAETTLGPTQIGAWLADPFNPYAIADTYKPAYLVGAKTSQARNFLDWADRLFTQDTPESVNRARELYHVARSILSLDDWDYSGTATTVGSIGSLSVESSSSTEGDVDLPGLTLETVAGLESITIAEDFPELIDLCLPPNPVLSILRWRIEANLTKLSKNQNIAGIERSMQLYAAPVDPTKLIRAASTGTLDDVSEIPSSPPPIFRFSFLIERAKYLVSGAQQLENVMLTAIQQQEDAQYTEIRARQDLLSRRSHVQLQQLRLQEATQNVQLAQQQVKRAEFSQIHYLDLLARGISPLEDVALNTMLISIALPSGITCCGPSSGVSYSPSGMLQTLSNIFATQATYERRAREWEFQEKLAGFDASIARVGVDMANTGVEIAGQEEAIARQELEFASDNLEFLTSRFTSKELFRWMEHELRRLYRTQLNLGYAMAHASQRALEFERQETVSLIGNEYWDDSRRGLLGAEKLLRDINQLEQYKINNTQRRREIETRISLANVAPAELEDFRNTGVLEFATPMEWFDRQFPGHYLRLIRSVSVSMLALVPPSGGLHATLSNAGVSRVVTGPPFEQAAVVYRLPESIALSGPNEATGLFEMRSDDPLLFPFEGSGVSTSWRLEMSKGANAFDYRSIADVVLIIKYTAQEDRGYRNKVLTDMGIDDAGFVGVGSRRGFSLRHNFADAWYLLKNSPPSDSTALAIVPFVVDSADFAANEVRRRIRRVTILAQLDPSPADSLHVVPLELEYRSSLGASVIESFSVVENRRSATGDKMRGKSPYGAWRLRIARGPGTPDLAWVSRLRDILVVFDYDAKVNYNR